MLFRLFYTFAKIGVMTFGGGYAMLPMLQRYVVEREKWATDEELADYFAVAQCTPGVIAVNTATFVGYKTAGFFGALLATLGVVFPSLVIIAALAGVIQAIADMSIVKNAFAGIRVCVCVLIFNSVIKLGKAAVKDVWTLLIFLAVTVIATVTDITPIIFVPVAALLGIIIKVWGVKAK